MGDELMRRAHIESTVLPIVMDGRRNNTAAIDTAKAIAAALQPCEPQAAEHTIVLISDDHGCQTHGLFSSFEAALAHAKKDGAHQDAQWEFSNSDRAVFLDGRVFWTATREPIRREPQAAVEHDRLAIIRGAVVTMRENAVAQKEGRWRSSYDGDGHLAGQIFACNLLLSVIDGDAK